MASDVLRLNDSSKGFDAFDSKLDLDIFLNDGVMDPKELYLTDLACSKDASSSSDSGISTHDDLPDIANDTDLQSLIDADFKDLDFNFDPPLSPSERLAINADSIINLEGVVKTEPLSPNTPLLSDSGSDEFCFHDSQSPDFYTVYNDTSISNDGIPLVFPVKCELPEQQNVYFQEIPDQQLNHHPVYSPQPLDLTQTAASSPSPPLCSLASPTILTATAPHQLTFSPQDVTNHHVHETKSPPLNFTVLPATTTATSKSNILVFPKVKNEILTVTPSPPTQPTISVSTIPVAKPASAINLNAILSSNVKIQPKPGLEKVVSIANTTQLIPTASSQVPLPSQMISVGNLVTSSTILSPSGITSLTDARTLKRAQRIIKNRESASLSRKRKKEYMSSLEERLQACVDENSRLILENEVLKKQVDSLQQENFHLKVPNGISPAKKMCLMCVGLLIVLNLSPYSLLSTPYSDSNKGAFSPSRHHAGRQLLSIPSDDSSGKGDASRSLSWTSSDSWSHLEEELSYVVNKLNISARVADICPMYFNSTESLRLAEQLTGWMIRQEEEKKKKEEKKRQKRKKTYPPLRRFGSYARMDARSEFSPSGRNVNGLVGHNYPVQVFSGGPDPRQQMLNAIHRRNDTFYVLSFSTDYFLVPATAHNKTMRPRMSLLMPVYTPTLNETTGQSEDSVAMMQIDCEIHNTNLIHIQRSALPKDATLNSTAQDHTFQSYGHNGNSSGDGSRSNSSSSGDSNIRQERKYWGKLRQRKPFS